MTLRELMSQANSENERKRILLAYTKGKHDGICQAIEMLVTNKSDSKEAAKDD